MYGVVVLCQGFLVGVLSVINDEDIICNGRRTVFVWNLRGVLCGYALSIVKISPLLSMIWGSPQPFLYQVDRFTPEI